MGGLVSNTVAIRKPGSNGYMGKPIIETLTNGFFTVDKQWTVTYWNKAAEKILGVQAKDILGRNLWEKFAGSIPLEFYNVYYKAFLQDIPIHFEEYWGEMGAWFDVVTYHCDDTLSVSFKSSNHPHSEYPQDPVQQLKTLTQLYRFITEVTNDCLWEWDLQVKEIFWIDGGHKRVLGYPIENALIPQSFWESCIHPDDKARILKKLNKTFADASSHLWEDEYRFKKADGDYIYVHDRGHIIYDTDNKASRMIGATQDISEKVLAQNKLLLERLTKQKEITNAVLTAQEHEREDIGKELHDNVNQILGAAKLYIEMAKNDEEKMEIYLEKSCSYILGVIEEIRQISQVLIPPGINSMGLDDSITHILDDLNKLHPIKIEYHKDGIEEKDLDVKMQLNIFRIIQEQLNNIIKHAEATRATINLSRHENEIILFISDNGKGCDMTKSAKGVGIRNIISRSELYEGTVSIVSKPGKGYQLTILLPLKTAA